LELFLLILFWFCAFPSSSLPFWFDLSLFLALIYHFDSGGVFEFCELFVILSFSWLFFAILSWNAAFHAFCWFCGFSFF
jgi:hypothetical protein